VFGVPGRRHDKPPDNSMDAIRAWQAREDAWLKEARQIDPATIDPPTLRATHASTGSDRAYPTISITTIQRIRNTKCLRGK